MMSNIKILAVLLLLLPIQLWSQTKQVLSLDTILQRIDKKNVLLQSYSLKAEGYKYSGDAATAWMAPMVGVGTFMTPYPFQEVMDDRDKGSLMFRIEQDIPNVGKLNKKKKFIQSQGNIENATRAVTLNDYKSKAKQLYYSWMVAEQRMKVLDQNEKIMLTMKKIEEVRYPYNQSQLGNVYKIDARIEENKNMVRMQEGEIAKARAWLNSLMNQPGNADFAIDTSINPVFNPALHDTTSLAGVRGDIKKMDAGIESMQLSIEAMKAEKNPSFKIQFDHMNSFDKMMPKAYSVMAMMSIPIAPWSSKMYKSDVKAMQYNVQAMEKEKSAMLQETQGMLYGMQYEILTMQKRIQGLETKIIPSMQKSLDVNFLNYQENKLQIPVVIDSWEALNMLQNNLLDEKLKLYQMIVDYEKELYR
ncbi:outer membrane protein TolC [Flavobacterium nitrogenifigens]|uniref:Outer membrane protein TolC n=5 Tax=Flavobacterium TaxID=237 RepID=A0A7W7N832_9FLAO|nr:MULTISPECIES: TolC family protein [Flavobacterium]MBB4803525.1 outer membrane protein TolC [Flavobacterium nitrogenifigens]MBB6388670.1 outer membrane protein TolC [Flavobacterium notoginsengisoli]